MLLKARHAAIVLALVACEAGTRTPAPDAAGDGGSTVDANVEPTRDGGKRDAGKDAGRIDDRAAFPDAGATPYVAELGVSNPATGDWAPLPAGGEIPIGGAGQVGLTARLAVRVTGAGSSGSSLAAIVRVVLTNPANGVTADSRPWNTRVPFECRDDGACYRVPVLVEISHIAKLPELEDLEVHLAARVLDAEAPERVLGQASAQGVLRKF